jgi:hypothetical protein
MNTIGRSSDSSHLPCIPSQPPPSGSVSGVVCVPPCNVVAVLQPQITCTYNVADTDSVAGTSNVADIYNVAGSDSVASTYNSVWELRDSQQRDCSRLSLDSLLIAFANQSFSTCKVTPFSPHNHINLSQKQFSPYKNWEPLGSSATGSEPSVVSGLSVP